MTIGRAGRAAFLIIFATLSLTACGGGGPSPETAALAAKPLAKSEARLKITRPSMLYGVAVDARVKIDGREVASLGDGDVKIFDVPAGNRQIVVDHWSHPNVYKLDMQAKPGMMYEFIVSPRQEAAVAGMFGLVGSAVEAAANENGGAWKIELSTQYPVTS